MFSFSEDTHIVLRVGVLRHSRDMGGMYLSQHVAHK